jgi:hypoxanthine phosphoribosyltransferase
VYVPAAALAERVGELGRAIAAEHARGDLLVVAVLDGGAVFAADLSRAIGVAHELAFLALDGYDPRARSSAIRLVLDLDVPVAGRDVVVLDDLVDTGLTLNYVLSTLRARRPRTLGVCALLDRPYRRIVDDLPLVHVGFTVADVELAGYGLDVRGRWRELPDLHLVS